MCGPHKWHEEKGEEISSFDRMSGMLQKGGENAKRKEKMKTRNDGK